MATKISPKFNYTEQPGTLFEDFETLGDWSKQSAGGSVEDETSIIKTGSHSVKLTSGDSTNCYADKTLNTTLSQGVVGYWVNLPTLTGVASVAIYLSSTTNYSKYFSRTTLITSLHEGWNYIETAQSEFNSSGGESWSNTFLRLRVRINASAGTPIAYFDGLYIGAYRRPKVLITFDDSWDSQYTKAYAYMQTLGLSGTMYTIGSKLGTANYCTLAQLQEMYAAGWDIGNHGSTNLTTLETQELQEAEISGEEAYISEFTRSKKHYAYPMGGYNDNAKLALANLGYTTARTIIDANQSNLVGESLLLSRWGIYNTTSVATAQGYIDSAINRGNSILLNFHIIVDSDADVDTKVLTADFNSIIDYVKTKSDDNLLDVVTISEWYNGLSESMNKTIITAQDQTGLVGQWSLASADYADPVVYGKGLTDQLTAVSSPALTTGFDGRANQALLFDGSADYLTQKVHDTQQGTVTASMVADTAFINDDGQDFTPYVGVSGQSKPYMLVATDSTGKKAWGYMGERGTGETLGNEKIGNGGFDSDTVGWTLQGTGALASVAGGQSGNCLEATLSSGTSLYAIQSLLGDWVASNLYKIQLWKKRGTGGAIGFLDITGSADSVQLSLSLTDEWTETVLYRVARTSGNVFYIGTNDSTAGTYLYDTISLKQVLTPTTNGVKIYSTKTGSTQSWANVESGFNANAISSYAIRKSDFQITGSFTLSAWVKTSSNTFQVIFCKKNDVASVNAGYTLYLRTNDPYVIFKVSDGSSSLYSNGFSTPVNDGNWHYLSAVWNGTNAQIYLDAVPLGTYAGSISGSLDTSSSLVIGKESDIAQYRFNGTIDEPLIYDRALSATEVLNLYNSQKRIFIS